VDLRSAPAEEPIGEPPSPPRQRWRLVLARSADATQLAGRELTDAWEQAIEATGLPLHLGAGRSRTRVALGAPLPVGMAAERELAEVVLSEVLPVWRVRDALIGRLPAGWRLVDLYDVWLGSPALAGRVSGAVYRVVVDGTADPDAVATAASALLAAERLPRNRLKGGSSVAYDLRPLLAEIGVVDPGPPVVLRVRTRIHPELGTGRPEEVLAALADRLGCSMTPVSIVRERLILADEPG
jgi:radical SAM-linked protein